MFEATTYNYYQELRGLLQKKLARTVLHRVHGNSRLGGRIEDPNPLLSTADVIRHESTESGTFSRGIYTVRLPTYVFLSRRADGLVK
jgi:hypothetical protein